jgi:hypothetical protein
MIVTFALSVPEKIRQKNAWLLVARLYKEGL